MDSSEADGSGGGQEGEEENNTQQRSPLSFVPKEDLLKVLQELGFSRNAALKGLYYTGNFNADLAAAWIFENEESPDLDKPLEESLDAEVYESMSSEDDAAGEDDFDLSMMYKMVFVVNMELGMGVGKTAAQVAHACLGLYRQVYTEQQKYGPMLYSWEQFGETKIVLKGENVVQITELAAKAESKHIVHYIVQDAGRTQIAPGSMTVLGLFGNVEGIDSVTGALKLL